MMQTAGALSDPTGAAAVIGQMSPAPDGAMLAPEGHDAETMKLYGMGADMPIEPLSGPRLLQMWRNWYQAKSDTELPEQQKARRYLNGKQWTPREIEQLQKRKQPVVTYNKIRRVVNGLVGVEQKLRRDPKAYPRNPNDDDAADLATSALRFVEDTTRFHSLASACALDAFTAGIGGVYQSVAEKRGKLEVAKYQIKSDRFFYDPRSERLDFSDARFIGQFGWHEQEALIEMLPQAEGYIDGLLGAANSLKSGTGMSSGNDIPTEALTDKEHVWVDMTTNRFFVVEIWYKRRGHWCYAFIVGPKKVAEGISPFVDVDGNPAHPYQMFTVYIDERLDRYGMVRDLISPQDEVNKRRSKLLHMGSVRQTKATKGAVDDVDAMRRELARPDGHVEVNPGLDFEVLRQDDQVQTHMALAQEAKSEIEGAGPNPNVIGRGNENQSGIAIARQQNAGMAELSMVFDNFREWKLRVYRQDWSLVQQFWTEERWIRITDDDGQPQFIGVNTPAPPGGPMPQGPQMGPPANGNSPLAPVANPGGGFGGTPPGGPMGPALDAMLSPNDMQAGMGSGVGVGAMDPSVQFQHPMQPMPQPPPMGQVFDMQGNPLPMIGQTPPVAPVATPIMNRIGECDVDIILDDAPDTVTMQQESVGMLMELAKAYGPDAAPLDLMVDLIDLKPRDKKRIREKLEQRSQPPPEVMEQQQIAKAQAVAKVRDTNAAANLKEAQAQVAGFGMQIDHFYAGIEGTKAQLESERNMIDAERLHNDRIKIAAQMASRRQQQDRAGA